MPHVLRTSSAIALTFAAATAAFADAPVLKSAGALAFDSANTLFVGDGRAGIVHAFELSNAQLADQSSYELGRAKTFEGRTIFEDINAEIGALLGVPATEVAINDMVVHKPTKQIFLSVHRGVGPDAEALIVKVNQGEIELVDLAKAKHSAQSIGALPEEETIEFGRQLYQLAITDIDYYNGEIFVAGVSNEEFDSTLRRISYPFDGTAEASKIEIWHAVHAQWETRAPIITQTIVELEGEATMIALYGCTPVVRIPLADLEDGKQVRGTMIAELGYGNSPIDTIAYTNAWTGQQNVLVTNTHRSAASYPLEILAAAEAMPAGEGVQPLFGIGGAEYTPVPISGVVHIDTIDDAWAVTVRENPEDPRILEMHTLAMPMFFERSDHVVEMNWDGAPDPFGFHVDPPLQYN
ncbi:hypothetical protein J7426_24300 [Tropicibacter sp. R16_0]|uniref:hypothetical protein n=1 Tax=Tropicibacter sp. R16_0 TaxID=2821102 RepID=UPI001ADA2B07|nr:hypothetical protein [Tropicibacter sp. R16_0]MBO9453403.1 hypothetical protein [Tropicibacter sp. R16_0]